jgi:hypothetical protein
VRRHSNRRSETRHEITALRPSLSVLRSCYQVACAYPDGTRVFCSTIAELRDGRIVRERVVQAWDS